MFVDKFLKRKYLITDNLRKIFSQDNLVNRLRKKWFFILFKKLPHYFLRPYSSKKIRLLGLSLMEILIIVTLIITIAVAVLILFNPKRQIEKGWDSKRKTELGQLRKILEDWYNDKNCYPRPNQICYDSVVNNTCHICGRVLTPTDFSPYLKTLPCDPQHPTKKYLYQVDNVTCPTWYRIYTTLSNPADPAINEVGCRQYCGIGNYTGFIYNYGISSPNTSLEKGPGRYACYGYGHGCTNIMYLNLNCFPTFSDPNCGQQCGSIKSTCVPK